MTQLKDKTCKPILLQNYQLVLVSLPRLQRKASTRSGIERIKECM